MKSHHRLLTGEDTDRDVKLWLSQCCSRIRRIPAYRPAEEAGAQIGSAWSSRRVAASMDYQISYAWSPCRAAAYMDAQGGILGG
jgi:hypothetical protein